MSKFIKGQDRSQGTLFPERLDDYVEEDSPVRVIDVFIDDPNRTVFSNVFVETLREQGRLMAIFAFDEAAHDFSSEGKV